MPMISPLVNLSEGTLTQHSQKLIKNFESRVANKMMSSNFSKTWEMLLRSTTTQPAPPPVLGIERKGWLKLSGITFHEDPCNWYLHIDSLLSRAASRLYIFLRYANITGTLKISLENSSTL